MDNSGRKQSRHLATVAQKYTWLTTLAPGRIEVSPPEARTMGSTMKQNVCVGLASQLKARSEVLFVIFDRK